MPRFFITEQPEDGLLALYGQDAHHASRVLRIHVGDPITLCDGAGTEYDCVVETIERGCVRCRVGDTHPSVAEPRQDITLYMAVPKGDKMEWVIQKTVELGARRIVPYLSQNCIPQREQVERKAARWQRVAAEAAGQSGRGQLPTVEPVTTFAEAVARATHAETALFFYEHERERGLRQVLETGIGATVSLLIGAEGGFTPEEAQAAQEAGLSCVSLGPRILRCETAPIAAIAALLYAGGNM